MPCCSSPPQGDGNVAMPGPPAGAVVEDVLGLEDAVLMIAPWRPGKKTGLLTGIVDMLIKLCILISYTYSRIFVRQFFTFITYHNIDIAI